MENYLPSTAIDLLRLGATSQAQIDSFSDQLIESVKNGEANALEVLVQLKAFEKVSERVIKETKEEQMKEAEKWAEKEFSQYGATISKAPIRTEYDYGVCNDRIYLDLFMKAQQALFLLDERKVFLRSLRNPMTVVDDSTGEVSTIQPPLKKVTDGLKISIR
jgi:hypothetical protein